MWHCSWRNGNNVWLPQIENCGQIILMAPLESSTLNQWFGGKLLTGIWISHRQLHHQTPTRSFSWALSDRHSVGQMEKSSHLKLYCLYDPGEGGASWVRRVSGTSWALWVFLSPSRLPLKLLECRGVSFRHNVSIWKTLLHHACWVEFFCLEVFFPCFFGAYFYGTLYEWLPFWFSVWPFLT